MNKIHLLRRKLKTIALTIRRCANWPAVVRAKIGLHNGPQIIVLRDGFQLSVMPPLKSTWGEVFEAAVADLYGISGIGAEVIVDVGANIGALACHAGFLYPQATVHAFEPSDAHAAILINNVSLNHLSNVIVHKQAVTRDGREVVFSRLGSGGSSGIFLHEGRDSAVTLQSVSLDVVDFTPFRTGFLKLDCEGAEGEIIDWICTNRDRLPPTFSIACEYHLWCPVSIDDSVQKLQAHGFRAGKEILFDEPYVFASRSL